jgi:hypothetical protein
MRILTALLVLALRCALAQPDLSRPIPISLESGHFMISAVAISPKSGSVWMIRDPDVLWRLDADGRSWRAFPIAAPDGSKMFLAHFLHVAPKGGVYLAGQTGEQPWLIKIAESGQTAFIRPIDIQGLYPSGLKPNPDGTWTVFGEGRSGACAARIDENGRKIWMRTFPKEKLATTFLGAVVLKDGSSILAGNIWDFHHSKIGMGMGSTMLVKLNPQGVTVAEKVFPGRNAILTQAEDGQIILIDDPQSYPVIEGLLRREKEWPMRMQSWSEELRLLWTAAMPGVLAELLPPEVVPAPGSGVIVFSNGFVAKSVLARYDAAGKQLWVSHPGIGFEMLGGDSGRYALVLSGPDGAMLTRFEEQAPNR